MGRMQYYNSLVGAVVKLLKEAEGKGHVPCL